MLHRLANSIQIVDTNVDDSGSVRPDIDEHDGTFRKRRWFSSVSSIPKVRIATPSTRRSIMRRTDDSIRFGSCTVEVSRIS